MKDITQELAEVMAEVGYVQKDATNTFQKYKYASAEAVLKKVNAELSKRGICVTSKAEVMHYNAPNKEQGIKAHAVVKLTLGFMKVEKTVVVEGLGEGSDSGDKAIMKANTAAIKYALANAFLISWGDDPEADASTDVPGTIKYKKKVQTIGKGAA